MQQPSIDSPDAGPPTVDRLADRIGRDQVFGPPVEQAGAVVVPVAQVRAGGASGPGRRGEGAGVQVRPVGAFSISAKGRVSWHPAVDVNRIVLGGQLVLGAVGLALALRRYGTPEMLTGGVATRRGRRRPGGPPVGVRRLGR